MAISRTRAKAIHEVNSWALWGTGAALLLRLTFMGEAEGVDLITGAMVVSFASMVLMFFLLPKVPAPRRKTPAKRRTKKRTTRARKRR